MKTALRRIALALIATVAFSSAGSAATFIFLNIGNAPSETFTDNSGVISTTTSFYIAQVQVLSTTNPALDQTINFPNNPGNTADDFSLTFNTGTPSFNVTIPNEASSATVFSNITSSTPLLTGVSGLTYTCASCSSTSLTLSVGGSGAFVSGVNTSFLQDIGLPSGTSFTLTGGITGGTTGSNDTDMVSDTLTLTENPEPSSIFLFGAGLAIVAAIAQKRRSGQAKTQRACA